MKKIFILLGVIAIHLAVFSQSNYNLKFDEKDFSFAETEMGYQILSKSVDYYLLEDPSLPALPYKNIYILIPENTDVENLQISVVSKEIRRHIYLMKNPIPVPVSENNNHKNNDTGNYSKNIYPSFNLKFETVIKSQGFYMAGFSVCPFIYHAQDSSLELITEMNISFDLIPAQSTYSGVKRYDMENLVKSLIINPEEIDILYPEINLPSARVTTNDVEYLIITSESLKESFNPLKAWKIRKGIKTEILSTNYIYSHYTGNTNQIKIKKCLQDYYENKNLKWVLLGGDDMVVPVQACYGQVQMTFNPPTYFIDETIPCDLFYACFDNAFDWNANGNDTIGEIDDNVDLSPEIYISRLPIRNSEHVTAFVNKLLKYEKDPATSDYVKKILLAGVKLTHIWDEKSDVHHKSERMYSENIAPFWNGAKYRFYDTGTDFPGGASYDVTATNLQTVLNNGYHFVHMASHGGITSWSTETGVDYYSFNASALQSINASVILTMACHTNGFDKSSDPCLSEAFIRNPKGACIAYWGSARYGWEWKSQTSELGPSFQYNAMFYFRLFNSLPNSDGYKFAAVTSSTKHQFVASSNMYNPMRWLQFSLNAIGCPEMPIYTEDPQHFTNVVISQNGTSITVNANVSGCTIAVTSIDDGQSYFQVAENVSSHTFTNVNVRSYITITKHNYIPYLGNFCTSVGGVPENISQNTTWDMPRRVTGVLTIQSGATLTITSQVECDADGSITVNPGGKLILNGGMLTNACTGVMWQGITVQGAFNNGIVEVNSGAIENAVCGIHSTNGGMIKLSGANFMNNTVSVRIDPVPTGQQGNFTTFENSFFTINDNYLGNPLNFETHIKLSNTYKVTVSGCTFKNEATQKSYQSGYNSGIWSFNAPLTVTLRCHPNSPLNPQTGECLKYDQSEFSGFNVAVSASNSGATPETTILNSVFKDNRYSIKIDAVNYLKLRNNTFLLTQDNSYGVQVSNSTGYKIEENTFQEFSPSSHITVGLTIINSGPPENEVYKNNFKGLYAGQNFIGENADQFSQNGAPSTGLQTLCNTFNVNKFRDVFVGYLPGVLAPWPDYSSIRITQGSLQSPAGNCFSQTISPQFDSRSTYPINYYYGNDPCENPVVSGSITKNPTYKASSCPSKIMGGGYEQDRGEGDIEAYLVQYDEWNLEYENWLKKLLATDPNSEEYEMIFDQVSYFSALKDNYFNWIIVAVINNYELGITNYETLRFLFNYRGHYSDNLSIVETYLAENNYREALATLASIYEKFELTEEQANELTGLKTYILWLQQLENGDNNIYELTENELDYLINYVTTNTGRGAVFANNILCELYDICLEDEMIRGLDDKMIINRGLQPTDLRKSVESALSAGNNALDKITLVPNPTTGELTITNYELEITNIEIYDIYGRKQSSNHLITSSSHHLINIVSSPPGIYFVKITTEAGEVVKKIIKQ